MTEKSLEEAVWKQDHEAPKKLLKGWHLVHLLSSYPLVQLLPQTGSPKGWHLVSKATAKTTFMGNGSALLLYHDAEQRTCPILQSLHGVILHPLVWLFGWCLSPQLNCKQAEPGIHLCLHTSVSLAQCVTQMASQQIQVSEEKASKLDLDCYPSCF